MIRRPPRSTHCISSAASDVYKRQVSTQSTWGHCLHQRGLGAIAVRARLGTFQELYIRTSIRSSTGTTWNQCLTSSPQLAQPISNCGTARHRQLKQAGLQAFTSKKQKFTTAYKCHYESIGMVWFPVFKRPYPRRAQGKMLFDQLGHLRRKALENLAQLLLKLYFSMALVRTIKLSRFYQQQQNRLDRQMPWWVKPEGSNAIIISPAKVVVAIHGYSFLASHHLRLQGRYGDALRSAPADHSWAKDRQGHSVRVLQGQATVQRSFGPSGRQPADCRPIGSTTANSSSC
eukprot:TRINITY_DN11768_c0_g1_i2.p2 TRINITY_DN11768_c0_g1~~TRINITY_DN11768_c0_g1_i2.p2  ORF type:complete len:288 (-),score=-9.36 TRINITY_DN11768_c0_g1_i2:268-1131(-)